MTLPSHSLMLDDALDRAVYAALRAGLSGQEPSARVRDDLLRAVADRSQPKRVAKRPRRRRRVRSGLWRDSETYAPRASALGWSFLAIESCRAKSGLVV